jgi:hypothetical protein
MFHIFSSSIRMFSKNACWAISLLSAGGREMETKIDIPLYRDRHRDREKRGEEGEGRADQYPPPHPGPSSPPSPPPLEGASGWNLC